MPIGRLRGMAYRDDVQALEARHAALSADLVARVRERDEVARLLADARVHADAEAYIADLESGGPARRRRKRLQLAALTTGIALAFGAVIAMRAKPEDHRAEDSLRAFDKFTDEMCACKDAACANHVSEDMTRWADSMQADWKPAPKFDDAQMKRATDLAKRMGDCMVKAMGAPQ